MVLMRPLCRSLRRRPAPVFSVKTPIRCLGTGNLHNPENSSPKSALNPTLRPATTENPVIEQYRQARIDQAAADAAKNLEAAEAPRTPAMERGNLSANSIFSRSFGRPAPSDDPSSRSQAPAERNLASLGAALDPRPMTRRRWERKMVIREIKKRGRLTKAETIKRTERELVAKSDMWRTSMKKLQPLARQIAGKSIEDAIVQMTFSKKKNAERIKAHLEEARDRAVVERGMGLGAAEGQKHGAVVIRDKDGNRKVVRDRTGIYIAQAWVGKGSYGRDVLPRARGRVDVLRLPQTCITVLLKEEATLVREHEERRAREQRKKLWTQLPDRPISEQRQFYCW